MHKTKEIQRKNNVIQCENTQSESAVNINKDSDTTKVREWQSKLLGLMQMSVSKQSSPLY